MKSPTRTHKPNVYKNTFSFKKPHILKKISTSKFICTNLRFFPSKIKDRALCFSTKKSGVSVVFKCKPYLKNSIELIKKISGRPEDLFSSPAFPETRVLFFLASVMVTGVGECHYELRLLFFRYT